VLGILDVVPLSMLDHSPADAQGGLPSAEQIAGRRADLKGVETTHQMHTGSWPTQVWSENRPILHQRDGMLLVQLLRQRVLADALPMPCGEPDSVR
jgi:hypothetical protein